LSYEGTISNSFLEWRITSGDTAVILYYCRNEEWSSEVMLVQFYYVLFLRSSVDKHLMPTNFSKIVVAPEFHFFCNDMTPE
jgi:hypothetical protein